MATGQWSIVLRHVQRLFQGGSLSGLSEGQLLERFASTRDEVAFEAILARHGPMVLGVCRGVLDDAHDVDDAFQATFLILVKKAGSLRDTDLLGQWLYGVARRVALRARSDASRRKARERSEVETSVEPVATLDAELRELQVLIREEVDRLSSNDRMAVVLCYLEGLTHEEAADRLGWPVGTVKGRLSRARDKLKGRLTRRGVALPTAALASTLANGASASVPLELLRSTTLAATRLAAGKTLMAGIVSAHAITLMEGVIGTMYATKLKMGLAALVTTCAVTVPSVLAFQGQGPVDGLGKAPVPIPEKSSGIMTKKRLPIPPQPDTLRVQEARLATEALEKTEKALIPPFSSPLQSQSSPFQMEKIPVWSRRLIEAKIGPETPEVDRKAALQAHRDRMSHLVELATELVKGEGSGLTELDVMEAKFRLVEADRWLRDGRIGTLADDNRPAVGGGPGGGPGGGFPGGGGPEAGPFARRNLMTLALNQTPDDEKRNDAIRAKLEEKISMNFATPTPLEDVKKYIVDTSMDTTSFMNGLPIFIDPEGLATAEVKMQSTITIQLESVPLRTTLRLILRQLGLDYRIDGGIILISDRDEIVMQEMKASRAAAAK